MDSSCVKNTKGDKIFTQIYIVHREPLCYNRKISANGGRKERMRIQIKKYVNRETAAYLFYGVLTTIINYGVFWFFQRLLGDAAALLSNVFAFFLATAFAFVTNKLFVFHSRSWRAPVLRKEIPAFLSARILSFLFEEAGLFVCANLLKLGRYTLWGIDGVMLSKIVLSLIVVVINYAISKFLIFSAAAHTGSKD